MFSLLFINNAFNIPKVWLVSLTLHFISWLQLFSLVFRLPTYTNSITTRSPPFVIIIEESKVISQKLIPLSLLCWAVNPSRCLSASVFKDSCCPCVPSLISNIHHLQISSLLYTFRVHPTPFVSHSISSITISSIVINCKSNIGSSCQLDSTYKFFSSSVDLAASQYRL